MKSSLETIQSQIEAERLLESTLTRMNARILGFTLGCLGATGLFLATLILLVKGGQDVGQHLNLLGYYFPGYHVSWFGLLPALLYGAIVGFVVGYVVSRVYNFAIRLREPERG